MQRQGHAARRAIALILVAIGFALQGVAYLTIQAAATADAVGTAFLVEKVVVAMIGGSLAICGTILFVSLRSSANFGRR